MPRKQKLYNYIYKTTCTISNRYYVGMHSTNDLEDGYLGSGMKLWQSVDYYGKENHVCEKLEFFETRKELSEREAKIVDEKFLNDPLCMNLALGGQGGIRNEDHAKKFHAAGGKKVFQMLGQRHNERLKSDPEYKKKYSKTISGVRKGSKNGFYGRKHSLITKAKMKDSKRNNIMRKVIFGNIVFDILPDMIMRDVKKYEPVLYMGYQDDKVSYTDVMDHSNEIFARLAEYAKSVDGIENERFWLTPKHLHIEQKEITEEILDQFEDDSVKVAFKLYFLFEKD